MKRNSGLGGYSEIVNELYTAGFRTSRLNVSARIRAVAHLTGM